MRTKYFLSTDKLCVWRFKNGKMTIIDFAVRKHNQPTVKRRGSIMELRDFSLDQQITFKQARAVNSKCIEG